MENKVLHLEQQLDSLEKSNPSLYMKEIKIIKKNAVKLENEINKLLSNNSSYDINSSESDIDNESVLDSNFDISNEINLYSNLINSLNDDNINNKTIEELSNILLQIENIEKNIIIYQNLNTDLDITNI